MGDKRQFFTEWMNEVFGTSVKKYLQANKPPLRALLVMNKAPGLEDDLLEELSFKTVKFLPPNTTPLLPPMDQQVIFNFENLYMKVLFQKCFEVTSGTQLILRQVWEDPFNILHCVPLLDEAWCIVSYKTVNSAWKQLWPEAVTPRNFEGFEDDPGSPTVERIAFLGKPMGLEANDEDVKSEWRSKEQSSGLRGCRNFRRSSRRQSG